MQGRPGQEPGGDGQAPRDRSSTSSFRLSDLQNRQPTMPQRPVGMARLEKPPVTPRVARPQREDPGERKPRTWKWWLGCTATVLVLGVVLSVVVYAITSLVIAYNVSSGSASTATDFLSNLQAANYAQAYSDLDGTLTVDMSKTTFTQKAQADDHCYGQVTDYSEVANSATSSTVGGVQVFSYAYTITRAKLKKSYQLTLTLQKDADGNWYITSYGTDLGPAVPTCA